MKIMVIGGGGREHAIIKKIKENKDVEKIYAGISALEKELPDDFARCQRSFLVNLEKIMQINSNEVILQGER